MTDTLRPVPLDRVTEDKVQSKALERILDERFEVTQLKDSIRNIGFLTIDRLVVIRLPGDSKYMAIEGNRRLAAIKSLLEDYQNGEIDLPDKILSTLHSFPVLVMEEADKQQQEYLGRLFQAIRHVSGIRPWGPYQQAQIIAIMLDQGRSYQEVKETLGLPTRRINILRRCYYALQQMKNDSDFGEYARPRLFSSFDEVFRVPKVRDWMQWNDETNRFDSSDNRSLFYSWIVGVEEEGQRHPAKIVDSKEIRRLPTLMDDPVRFRNFCEDPTMSIEHALMGIVTPPPAVEWRHHLNNLLSILSQIPAVDLQEATDTDVNVFEQAQQLCERHIRMIRSYRQT